MKEAAWLRATGVGIGRAVRNLGPRKSRLLASAACRLLSPLLDDTDAERSLDVAEQFADGAATTDELDAARRAVHATRMRVFAGAGSPIPPATSARLRALWAFESACAAGTPAGAVAQVLLGLGQRDPPHPAPRERLFDVYREVGGVRPSVPIQNRWLAPTVVNLAQTMYLARNFAAMPVLADALEEAGCDNADILAHCRGPGPHVRGCWVVDLVLGKS